MPAFPTVDVTCDQKLRTIPLARSENAGESAVAADEVPHDVVEAILKAGDCRLFVPGVVVSLPRQQLWKVWTDPSKGAEAPKVIQARVLEGKLHDPFGGAVHLPRPGRRVLRQDQAGRCYATEGEARRDGCRRSRREDAGHLQSSRARTSLISS